MIKKLRQEDCKFKASLKYRVKLFQKRKERKREKKKEKTQKEKEKK